MFEKQTAAQSRRRTRATLRIPYAAAGLVLAAVLFVLMVNLLIIDGAERFIIQDPGEAPKVAVAIVPGAHVTDGVPSPMLADRLETAIRLYKEGKTERLLVSGNGRSESDQVIVMAQYLIERGVAADDVIQDPAGFTTYRTMLRARNVYHVTQALVVTQRFHLSRSVYLARSVGIYAIGIPADIQSYADWPNSAREWLARVKAFLQVNVF